MTRQSLYRVMTLLMLVSILAPSAGASSPRQPVEMPASQPASLPSLTPEQDDVKPPEPGTTTWQELAPEVRAKIDPRILAELNGQVRPAHLGGSADQATVAPTDARKPLERTRFLVYLKAKADLESVRAQRFSSRVARRSAVLNELVSTAQATQGPVATLLSARMSAGDVASYQPFYIFNGFAVEGDLETVIELARRDDVERVVANYPKVYYRDDGDKVASRAPSPLSDLGGLDPANWNIDLVDAERVWDEFGITGQGAVVAIFDSGADWTHPALQPRYRGYSPAGSDHNYHWFETDPFLYAGGDLGPSMTAQPIVYDSHGTHVLGTMVGDGGTPGTQVGMAPGAQWIGIADQLWGEYGDDISTHKAFQWLLAPTDLTGQLSTADPARAPDVINCSWGIANPADDFLEPDIAALRAAGIAVVFAAGNPGAGEGSIGSPGSAPSAITVGATDIDDNVASFSGRGPSFWADEKKPEVTAPGVNVHSTVPGGGYSGTTWSGTSMAAPAVSGLAALMISADLQDGIRDLDVDDIENLLIHSALDLGPPGFDNDYGYGRIDAYEAVRWALSAGDLQGSVTDQSTTLPIAGAMVAGSNTGTGDAFATASGVTGTYSTTVPAGTYDVSVAAWGYVSDTFSGQTVLPGALSIADFDLAPLPSAQLTGQVLSGTTPISGASVYVEAHPATGFTTGADGAYTLTLPVDTHEMVVEARGYRVLHQDVSVAGGGSSHDFSLTPAPSILLVEADRAFGWLFGNPVKHYIGWGLDYEQYLYDTWEIQYTHFNGTQLNADGSMGYGVPTTTTLRAYDVVIWTHGGGQHHPIWGALYGLGGSPAQVDANDELMDYLNAGGRLILSGQDVGFWEDGDADLYDNYVRADLLNAGAASVGETTTGAHFLSGLDLELTDASLKGYENGATYFYPDAVAAQDGSAYSVLDYDNGNGSAVLAVAPCDAPYRMVYVAAGLEAFAPRTGPIPEYAEMLDRSLQWLGGSKPAYDVRVSAIPTSQVGEPGSTVSYDVRVANTGATTDTFTLSVGGNLWATRIYSGGVELTTTVELPPCIAQDLTAEVDIPAGANTGDTDIATLTATGNSTGDVDVTTVAFPQWQIEPDAPYAASRVSLAGWGDSVYLMGGNGGTTTENYQFNACTSEWMALAPIPIGTQNHAAAVLDGKIYVTGGAVAGTMDNLQIYDIASDSWAAGAAMPGARWAHAAVALNGEIYVIGGLDSTDNAVATTFVYSPTLDSWRTVTSMSAPRFWVAGAALNGKLYIVGGAGELSTVEAYDPATDTWTIQAPMLQGRAAAGAAGVDGYLYVVGGGYTTYLPTSERYNPATDTWEAISSLNTGRRTLGVAHASGKLFAANGWDGNYRNNLESLRLTDAFCLSDKAVEQSMVQPGERITYTLEIHSDAAELASASVVDPVPAGTTWAGFGANPAGATYNAGQDRVEWSGTLPVGSDPLTFTFGVDVDPVGWATGELVTNTVLFDSGAGQVFTRTTTTQITFPDPAPSAKTVNASEALAGEVLTYTVRVENISTFSDTFSMRDPVPVNATYVPGSLTYTLGTAGYDPVGDVITWTSPLPALGDYVNTSGSYEWGDSDGNGDVPGVTFDWIDISATGTPLNLGDDTGTTIPIGFNFTFYGNTYPDPSPVVGELGVASNGYLTFEPNYDSNPDLYDDGEDCPIVNSYDPNDTLAPFWGDLDAGAGNVYYQLFGSAPNRYLVIQWQDVYIWNTDSTATFQAILYEGSDAVKFQYQSLTTGTSYVVGIENRDGSSGLTYNTCGNSGIVYDGLAVVFVPNGATWRTSMPYADVTFVVTTTAPLPANTWITNTATITGPFNNVQRSATTLINPIDLSASTKTADKAWAGTGEVVTFDFVLANTGLLTATALLTDPIPAHTAYVPGSVDCGGTCSYDAGLDAVTWNGDISPGAPVTLTFAVTLTDTLVDLTQVTNTATLDDGAGTLYELIDVFLARSPNLGASFKQVMPDQVEPGETVTYTLYVRNTGFVPAPGAVSDPLPPELTYVPGSLICGSGSCGQASGTITWTGTVPARGMVPVQFRATVPAGAAHGELITNTATVTDGAWSTDYPVTAAVEIVEPADLWVTKAGPGTAEASATLVYTLTYGNDGPYNARVAAQVVDALPSNVSYVDASPAGVYSATAGTVTWDVGTLNAGVSATLILTAEVDAGTPPLTVLTDTVTISTIPQDLEPANNTDTLLTVVGSGVNLLDSTKTASPADVTEGDTVTYTIRLANTGNVTASVTLTDPIPAGAAYVLGSGQLDSVATGLYNDVEDRIEWTGQVPPLGTVVLRFQAQITVRGGEMVRNVVTIEDGAGMVLERQAIVRSTRYDVYMPLVSHSTP